MRVCCNKSGRCGGRFDAEEIRSGRIEGGDYDSRRPDKRLIQQEEGARSAPLPHRRQLRGGL